MHVQEILPNLYLVSLILPIFRYKRVYLDLEIEYNKNIFDKKLHFWHLFSYFRQNLHLKLLIAMDETYLQSRVVQHLFTHDVS